MKTPTRRSTISVRLPVELIDKLNEVHDFTRVAHRCVIVQDILAAFMGQEHKDRCRIYRLALKYSKTPLSPKVQKLAL